MKKDDGIINLLINYQKRLEKSIQKQNEYRGKREWVLLEKHELLESTYSIFIDELKALLKNE